MWQADMKRLATHLGSDKSVNDPSRVMRLPGCLYMGPDQQPVARSEIVHVEDPPALALLPYTREDIIGALQLILHRCWNRPLSPNYKSLLIALQNEAEASLIASTTHPGSNTRDAYLRLAVGSGSHHLDRNKPVLPWLLIPLLGRLKRI